MPAVRLFSRRDRTALINQLAHQILEARPRPGHHGASDSNGSAARFAAAALALAAGAPVIAYLLVGGQLIALSVATLVYLLAAALAGLLMARCPALGQVGMCNIVTLTRLVLTSALAAPLVTPGTAMGIVTVASLALILDGIDGWLARRHGHESAFGARFDMEVDAALGLVLALNAWAAGTVGPVVLLLGVPRYLFGVAGSVWPMLGRPLPERFGRKVVCVLQIVALIALQLPWLAGPTATAVVLAALLALAWSFGRDVLWLWKASS
ncbi:MAG: CDP-alcohol phosphatidyltransferase family protein [Pseudomonadota bacterium]